MKDFFEHLNQPLADFGMHNKNILGIEAFTFPEPVEIDGFVRIDEDVFMAMTIVDYNDRQFDLSLLFSLTQIQHLAEIMKGSNTELSNYLESVLNAPFRAFEEINFPSELAIDIRISTEIASDTESLLLDIDEEFLPLRVRKITSCQITDRRL